MSKLISNILLFSFLCSMIMLMIGGVIMNIKKKAYLYLGLLGVGLMLGSFGALISRNTGFTVALPDDTSDCDDASASDKGMCFNCIGSSGTWDSGSCSCPPGMELNSTGKCVKKSSGGSTGGNKTSCSEYDSATATECSNCQESSGTWSFSSNSCRCQSGYTLDDDGICQRNTGSSCSDYSNESGWRDYCSNCQVSSGTWSFSSHSCRCPSGYTLDDDGICQRNTGSSCSDYSNESGWRDYCSNCQESSGTWSFSSHSCRCQSGYTLDDDGICQRNIGSCDEYTDNNLKNDCKQCENGTWNFDTNSCVCKEGYEDSGEGLCVKKSSSGSSHKSGFYFIDANGNCKEYPKLPGYCVEAGTKFNRDKLSDYTIDYSVTLSCMEIAAGYFGQKGSGEDYYSAQAKLNGRQYYTDARCTTKVEGSATGSGSSSTDVSVSAEASAWCNTKPSFDGETVYLKVGESKTLTDTTGSLSDFTISGGSSSIRLSSSDNSITVTALAKSGCEAFTMSKGNSNSYQVYGYVNSQKYAEIYNLPLVTASFTVCTTDETVPDTYGGFKIVKKDGDNVALSGVKFKVGTNLHGTEGTDWSYMTTDVNGEIKVGNIKSGTKMYYQEVSTKDGYVLDGNIYNLSIKANEIITVTVLNYKNDKVMFKLLKTNEGGGPLPGVKFKVGTNLNGTEGTDWSYMITDASGVITVGNIPKGTTYYYQEISTLDGYIVDNTIKKVILDVDNGIYVKGEVNYLDRVATIVKKDAETGQVLRNVVFEIYDAKTDKLLYTKTTDALGKIVLKGISNGKYYAKEKSAPDGYLLNTDKHSFEISDTNKSVEIVITNKKDNPNTGSTLIYVTMVLGLICLCVSVVQYRKLKNIEFM